MRRRPSRLVVLCLSLIALVGADDASVAGEDTPPAGAADVFERVLSPAQRYDVRFLQHLGWRFVRDPSVSRLTIHGGQPCRHPTLQAAHAAGALRILVPPGFGEEDARAFGRLAAPLADGVASRCAYQLKVAVAARKAIHRLARLSESGLLEFPHLFGLVHSPVFVMSMPTDEWEERERLWVASRSAREALDAVYVRGAKVDCYVGQILALYSIQYELYGPAGFDRAFAPDEVAVGRPGDFLQTPVGRPIRGDGTYAWRALLLDPPKQRTDVVLGLAPHGPTAFVGLTGILRNQDPKIVTNDNFMILRISERALRDLAQGGGLRYLVRLMSGVWAASNSACGLLASPEAREAAERRVDALLARPVFSEFELYVQPDGILTLADLVRKWMDRTDAPLYMRLYVHGLEDFFYGRYRKAFLDGCRRELAGAKETAPAPGR